MKLLYLYSIALFLVISNQINAIGNIQPFKLSQVKLLDSPFLNAQQLDLKYILELDMDRLLAPFLKDAGIKPIKQNYGNWESMGLDGHTGGHYLSALSLMYASTGNEELLLRLNYMINWLDSCQRKNGNGYVGGIPDGLVFWNDLAAGNTAAVKTRWVPLYNIHKLYAGLLDAYLYTNNTQAWKVLIKLSDWFYNLSLKLSDDQIQQILKTEHGGLNDVFAEIARITRDKKYLDLAIHISHKAILEPLAQYKNLLAGLHANTQIPKIIGFKRIADVSGEVKWDEAAKYFWETVVHQWTVSIGGNSVREHFHPTNDFSSVLESNEGPETCNTYNMLKLTEQLFLSNPETKYMDYYEKALFNHILSSEHPTKGGFVYFTQMRPRHYRVYSQPQEGFWCCVGTGMENHAKYGEMIYAHADNSLFVNLFIASELNWEEKGIIITQKTNFPYKDFSIINIKTSKPIELNLKIRKPVWANSKEIKISINGKKSSDFKIIDNYITLLRTWNNSDELKIEFPMHIGLEYLPDGSPWTSIKYGPIVLAAITDSTKLDGLFADAGRMGHVANGSFFPINEAPTLITETKDFSSKIKALDKKQLTFKMPTLIYPKKYKKLVLRPFYEIHEARYQLYWPVSTQKEYGAKQQLLAENEKIKLALEKRTIDQIAPGEQQPETDHNFRGEKTNSGINNNVHWRDASGWFSYDLFDKQKEAAVLQISYFGLDRKRTFDIYVNDIKLETVTLNGEKGEGFFNLDFNLPEKIRSKNNGVLNVRFIAAKNSIAGGIYYIRLLR